MRRNRSARFPRRELRKYSILGAAAWAALCGAGQARAELIGQWVGDNYTSGNWIDSSGHGNDGVAAGAPAAVPNAFATHTGVNLGGGDYFTVPNNAGVMVGAGAMTIAAVFNPADVNASTGGQFWQKAGLIGNEQGGAVNDWGLGFGASQADFGVGAPDTTILSGNLDLGVPHVVVGTWSTSGTMTLYVDGAQVAQRLNAPTALRNANAFPAFALGANLSAVNNDLKPFIGSIAELRIYNDVSVDPIVLSNSLNATYVLGLTGDNTWLPGSQFYDNGGFWSAGHVPATGEQAVIANGATVTLKTDAGAPFGVKISNGTFVVATDGVLNAGINLAPGSGPGTATLNLSGGTLTVPFFQIDGGTAGGTAAKAINLDGGTLITTGNLNIAGVNLTTTVGAGGVTIDTQGTSVVNWSPALTPTAPTASLTKLGAGTLNLLGGGYPAPLTIKAGTLSVAGDLGNPANTIQLGDTNVVGGDTAALTITAAANVFSPITVGSPGGSGNYSINLTSTAGATLFVQPITLNASLTVSTAATTDNIGAAFSGGFSAAAPFTTLTFDNAGLVTVASAGINDGTGTLALVKNNSGILILQAANNYSQGTTINNGAIIFAAPQTVGGTGNNVTINAGGVAGVGAGFDLSNVTGTFLSRVDHSSQGAVVVLGDSSESFDFSPTGLDFPNLFFGLAGGGTYTGTITPAGGIYRLFGAQGNFLMPNTNAITGDNSLIVNGALDGGVLLGAPNNFTGGSTVNAGGTLAVLDGTALGSGLVQLSGGTLAVLGTTPATITQQIAVAAGGNLRVDNPSASFTNDIIATANGNFTKSGTGTANFAGNVDMTLAVPLLNEGTSIFSGTSTLTAGAYFSIAQGTGNVAAAIFQDTSTANVATDFNVADTQNSIGKLYIRDNATLNVTTLYVGKGQTADGSILQSGGTLQNNLAPGEWRIGGGTGAQDANAVGSYTMTGGTLNTAANFQVGAFGRGSFTMLPGATAATGGYTDAGRFNGSYGQINIIGAAFTHANPNTFMIVGESGAGRLNIAGSGVNPGVVSLDTAMRIGLNADGEGHVNLLTGGSLVAPGIIAGSSTNGSSVNFHGGSLVATTPGVNLISGVNAYVYSEGGTIDTAGNDVSLSAPLLAPAGQGLASVQLATGGAGYVSHPVIEITGGGGKGAAAMPILNASGAVTGITITNPGTGYTSPPAITLKGGGATTPATLGTVALASNVSGGITKIGAGTLTLSGNSTFTGPTTIAGGTIKLPAKTALAPIADWNADSVAGNNGDSISAWTDSVGSRIATPNNAGPVPTLLAAGLGTHQTLHFDGTQSLQVADVDSPIANASNFSIAVVFKTGKNGAGGEGQWYQNTGIVDSEQPGTTDDWGMVLNGNGRAGAGIGAPGADRTIYSKQPGLADGQGHVAILTRGDDSTFTLTIDGQTVSGATGDVAPRNLSRFLFGAIQTNLNFYTGDIAQVRMYDGVLGPTQIGSLGTQLSTLYGIANGFSTSFNFLSPTSPIVISAPDGVLDLSDNSVMVGSLAGVAQSKVLLGSGTLTIGADNSSPTFSGTISGTGGLTKIGAGAQTLDTAQSYTGATAVTDGTLRVTGSIAASSGVTVNGPAAIFEAGASQTVQSLSVTAGQTKITRPGAAATVLTIGDNVNAAPLAIGPAGTVDLTTNAIIVDHPAGAEQATLQAVRDKIISGYNGGDYQGKGITSSSAAADSSKGVGYASVSELALEPGHKFLGQNVDDSAVVARYTITGDANLDGQVGFPDLVTVAQHYDQVLNDQGGSPSTFTNSWWTHGDFNYDGLVGFADLVKVAQNYDGALPAALPGASADFNAALASAASSVPEPSSAMSLLGAAAMALSARRRRRSSSMPV